MNRSMKWLSLLAVCAVWQGAIGCGPAEETETEIPVQPCPDPALGDVEEACGLWVSASLGDDANPGTRAKPMASLSAAVELAYEKTLDVYACGEIWTEPLILPPDVSLFGGFDCEDGWAYKGISHRAVIQTGPELIPLKTSGYGGRMFIHDIDIRAADATVPGGSSIAVLVTDRHELIFRRSVLEAGNAVDGLNAEQMIWPAPAGTAGNIGANACTTMAGPGGAAVETACDPAMISRGGEGGDGGPTLATDGEAGLPEPAGEKDPGNLQDGDGGKGQVGAEACTAGEPGQDGADGALGESLSSKGTLTADGFFGTNGTDGQPGAPGQGGGAGGASRGGAAACGAGAPGGAGGGSGGAGGCGGKGGKGGQAGGSSIAVAAIRQYADVYLESCELWVGHGGDGGNGAPGQPGGPGGAPGQGGAANGTAQAGCQGGKGGAGGKGGSAAGGHGGHCKQIAVVPGAGVHAADDTTFGGGSNGSCGLGGQGGEVHGALIGRDGEGNGGTYATAILGLQQQ